MDKQVTKEQIGSIVALLVAGKVPFEEVQAFIDTYKAAPSLKRKGEARMERRALPSNHYRLHVSYSKILVSETPLAGVSYLYDRSKWIRHNSCIKIDGTPGVREFMVAEIPVEFLDKQIDAIEDALAEHFDRLGYRFAIAKEAIAFMYAYPDFISKDYRILALGSSLIGGEGGRGVVELVSYITRRLCTYWVGSGLSSHTRLLLVSKVNSTL